MFTPNESKVDRIIRLIVGVILLYVGYAYLSSPWNWVAYVVGAIAVITAATGFCLLYRLLGISTGGGQQQTS